jgi:hypothetical protein
MGTALLEWLSLPECLDALLVTPLGWGVFVWVLVGTGWLSSSVCSERTLATRISPGRSALSQVVGGCELALK